MFKINILVGIDAFLTVYLKNYLIVFMFKIGVFILKFILISYKNNRK